ncbi:hypothetical protein, partial [Lactococcus petauri]|uniref:hypothetical protein n=1 Tax=Lactococcus petauri TaxID=1940789 RepID=UPI0021F223F9
MAARSDISSGAPLLVAIWIVPFAKWDPHTHPIVTELKGTVTFVGMEEGITIKRQTDELTGLTNIEVLDVKDRPAA